MSSSTVSALASYGYVAIFFLMLLESACIPIPSEVTMLVGGALADSTFAASVSGDPLNVVWVGLVGTAGNLVGSWIAWAVGYKGGRPLVERWGRYIRLNSHHLDKAEVWFAHRGQASVFVARLLPVLRTFISLPAGVARMPFWRFTIYTVVGCLPWTFALAYAGKALGSQWDRAANDLKPFTYVIAVAVVVGAVIWYLRVRSNKRSSVLIED